MLGGIPVQWAVLERSVVARYALAAMLGGLAAAAHWAMYPYIHGRIPFLLFLPSIILVTALAGRGPGLIVIAIGVVNASLQLAPIGSIAVAAQADRLVLAA